MTKSWPREAHRHGITYWLLEPITAQRARVRFEGRFEDRSVTWDATLQALGEWSGDGERRAYIDIGDTDAETTPIEIGLEVAALDETVILRAILMVRQYKRLRRGHMRFGESLL